MKQTENRALWNLLKILYSVPVEEEHKKQPKSFFTKEEIRTGRYQMHRIRDYGLDEWREAENLLSQYRGNATFELFLFALNQEKLGRAKKGKQNAKRKKESAAGTSGDANNLRGLACDKLGQYLLFPEDGNI